VAELIRRDFSYSAARLTRSPPDHHQAATARASRDGYYVRSYVAFLNLIQIKNPGPKSRARRKWRVTEVSLP